MTRYIRWPDSLWHGIASETIRAGYTCHTTFCGSRKWGGITVSEVEPPAGRYCAKCAHKERLLAKKGR